ncbi:MAG: hypothetical protein ABI472_01815 [Ginsengibacter sp.]
MNIFFYKAVNLKKISSILLLLVFVLGITPKKTLHNWFAKHTDSTSSIPDGKTQQLTIAGFNCNCENLVAESHFLTFGSFVVVNRLSVHSFISFCIPSFISLSLFHNNLRGPPLKF